MCVCVYIVLLCFVCLKHLSIYRPVCCINIPLITMPGFAERCRYTYLSEIDWPPTQTHEVHIKVSVITFMSLFFKAKIRGKSKDTHTTAPLFNIII